ncbi:MAG TPA: hypothetical protein DDY78_29745 [Planctomycetales bacterium]|nr:hypothetical protein [Planctomycetales bacterium]
MTDITDPAGETIPPTQVQPDLRTDGDATASMERFLGVGAGGEDEDPEATKAASIEMNESSRARSGASLALPMVPGYQILGELGRGGMGVVYKARHLKLNRVVALKMILSGGYAGATELSRFRSEAEVVARLQHPNIVQIYDLGEENGLPFLALEYLEGGSLAAKLAGTPLEPREAARLTEALARGVHAAHEKGVIHRDLKPANVLLAADGTPKIVDFGLAHQTKSDLTSTGAVMGTPCYMAPEQALGLTRQIGPATDIYALGAVLYDLLTGRPPFKAATAAMTIQQVVREEPAPPRRLQPQTPRDLENVCLKCLHKAPNRRYPTAQALAEDLGRFLAGRPVLARPVGTGERLARWVRREPAAAGLTGTALLLVASLLGWVIYAWREAEAGRATEARRVVAEAEQRREVEGQLYLNRVALADRELSAGKPAWASEQLNLCSEELRAWEWNYLRRRVDGTEERVLEGHTRGVSCVAVSRDGTRIASASGDGSVRLWEAATGEAMQVLSEHRGSVNWVAFSPDGDSLASAGEDGRLIIWDARTGEKRTEFAAGSGPLSCVAFHPSGLEVAVAAFGGDGPGEVGVWRVDTGEKVHTLTGHTSRVSGLAYRQDGAVLATASHDQTVRLWDSGSGEERLVFRGHGLPVAALAFSPDGRTVASAGGRVHADEPDEGEILIWSAQTGQVEHRLRGHAGRPVAVAFSPDGRRLATGSWDHEIKLWDTATGLELLSLRGHRLAVMGVVFAGGGRYLVSGSLDHTVRIWDGSK